MAAIRTLTPRRVRTDSENDEDSKPRPDRGALRTSSLIDTSAGDMNPFCTCGSAAG